MIPIGLRIALRHLTVLPVAYDPVEATTPPARALRWFPLVGVSIGLAAACALSLPFPPPVRAALALAVWIWLSGALHEDGLMDSADAALAPVQRARRLEILRDPHVGAFAVSAEATLLLVRFAALLSVPSLAPIVAALTGRWTMTLSLALWRPARPDGLGARWAAGARSVGPTAVALALLASLTAAETLVFGGMPRAPLGAAAGVAAGLVVAGWLDRRFGGLTGDAHGGAAVIAESAVLLAYAWGTEVTLRAEAWAR